MYPLLHSIEEDAIKLGTFGHLFLENVVHIPFDILSIPSYFIDVERPSAV
jgi:hypothetical protein